MPISFQILSYRFVTHEKNLRSIGLGLFARLLFLKEIVTPVVILVHGGYGY